MTHAVSTAPVLIVGGGGAGLTSSMLLSQLGVETAAGECTPTTSVLPKAHVLNQRAMEVLQRRRRSPTRSTSAARRRRT